MNESYIICEYIIYNDSLELIDIRNLFPKDIISIEYEQIKPLNGRSRVKVTARK